MTRIDERSTIPITWVVAIVVCFTGILITGTSWVFQVNNRLNGIERALGIQAQDHSENVVKKRKQVINEAQAGL